jgi:predicted secreted hydrolase
MIYQLRRSDGTVDPRSSGTLVEPDGHTVPIRLGTPSPAGRGTLGGFTLEPQRTWTSPITRAQYPVAWRLRIPDAGVDLEVRAVVDQQELATTRSAGVSYWEGAIDVSGQVRGHDTRGRGYLEMTGYAGRPVGNLFSTFR